MKALRFFIYSLLLLAAPIWAANEVLLQKIIDGAKASGSDSLVIIQDGKTVYSDDFGRPDQIRSIQSVTKSICALEIGILLEEGKIKSLDLPMSTWIPAWSNDARKSKITLRMIMNHTSGLPDSPDDFWSKPDIVGAAENIDPIADTSVQFLYSNIGASLLQPVIEKAAGKSPTDFVREKIFAPMGITDFKWNRDKAVHEGTSGGIYLSTADMRKLGKLMLQEGVYDGRMIIHQATLRMLLQKSQPFEDYGLLWWLVNPAANYPVFSAVGWGGQYVAVLPAKHLVAVRTRDPAGIDEVKLPEQKFEEFRNLISQWE